MSNQTQADAAALADQIGKSVDLETATPEFLERLCTELDTWEKLIRAKRLMKLEAARDAAILAAKYTPGMIAALETLLSKGYLHSGRPSGYDPDAVPAAVIRALKARELVWTTQNWRSTQLTAKLLDGREALVRQVVEKARAKTAAKTKTKDKTKE